MSSLPPLHQRSRTYSDGVLHVESDQCPHRWERQMEELFDSMITSEDGSVSTVPEEFQRVICDDCSVRGANLFGSLFSQKKSPGKRESLGWKAREDMQQLEQDEATWPSNGEKEVPCSPPKRRKSKAALRAVSDFAPVDGNGMSAALNLKIRKAFTKFHNQHGGEAAMMFLGDESSIRMGNKFSRATTRLVKVTEPKTKEYTTAHDAIKKDLKSPVYEQYHASSYPRESVISHISAATAPVKTNANQDEYDAHSDSDECTVSDSSAESMDLSSSFPAEEKYLTSTTNFPLAPLAETAPDESVCDGKNGCETPEILLTADEDSPDDAKRTSLPEPAAEDSKCLTRHTSMPYGMKPVKNEYFHPGSSSILPAIPSHKKDPDDRTQWLLPHIMAQANTHHARKQPELAEALLRRSDAHCFQLLCRSARRNHAKNMDQLEYDDSGWTSRWFLIRHNFLSEYRGRTRLVPIGMMCLTGARVTPGLGDFEEYFTVTLPMVSLGKDNLCSAYDFKCENREQALACVAIFEHAAKLRLEDIYTKCHDITSLGSGRFASVLEVRRSSDGTSTAIKLIDKPAFWNMVRNKKERADTLVREITAQALLSVLASRYPNVPGAHGLVKLHDVFETRTHIALELELMKGGDLFKVLDQRTVLSESEAAGVIQSMLEAVAFMKSHKIAHRDIKLANVIFDSTDASKRVLKIADFGMAAFENTDGLLRGRCGTPGYVAPEILHAGPSEAYPNKVDVYSTGVVAYILLCGYEPFYGSTERQLIAANKRATFAFHNPEWKDISVEAKDFVSQLMQKNPSVRLTPDQALAHPWLVKHCNSSRSANTRDPGACREDECSRLGSASSCTNTLDVANPAHNSTSQDPLSDERHVAAQEAKRHLGPRRKTWHRGDRSMFVNRDFEVPPKRESVCVVS